MQPRLRALRVFKALIAAIVLAVVALAAAVVIRAARSETPPADPGKPDRTAVDAARVAAHLSEAIRFRTISHQDPARVDGQQFAAFRAFLSATYPLVHARLKPELISDHGLLFTWEGSGQAGLPVLLMAHMDVVPVESGTETAWRYPPFEGRIASGLVWGRGAIDDKIGLVALMEAFESLLAAGFEPRRTVYIELGQDEEVGGARGAFRAAELLRSRGVRLDGVLDEGGAIVTAGIPAVGQPVALIGIAEKGYLTLELSADSPGGHSSTPPPHTATGLVSGAVARLEANPMPAAIRGAARQTIDQLAPLMPFRIRLVMANLWLFGPLVRNALSSSPASNALIRTTTAATMIVGSARENVLPARASAIVNFRILPGDTVAGVTAHARRAISDPRIRIRRLSGWDPSKTSDLDSAAGRLVQKTVRQVFPEAAIAPALMLGASDSRHFRPLTPGVYNFLPIVVTPDSLRLAHGTNERIPVEDCGRAVRFYMRLLRNWAE